MDVISKGIHRLQSVFGFFEISMLFTTIRYEADLLLDGKERTKKLFKYTLTPTTKHKGPIKDPKIEKVSILTGIDSFQNFDPSPRRRCLLGVIMTLSRDYQILAKVLIGAAITNEGIFGLVECFQIRVYRYPFQQQRRWPVHHDLGVCIASMAVVLSAHGRPLLIFDSSRQLARFSMEIMNGKST